MDEASQQYWAGGKSINAQTAESDGRYPKTQFKKIYGIDPSELVKPSEWHHSSKYFNKVDYYSLDDVFEAIWELKPEDRKKYFKNKKFIDLWNAHKQEKAKENSRSLNRTPDYKLNPVKKQKRVNDRLENLSKKYDKLTIINPSIHSERRFLFDPLNNLSDEKYKRALQAEKEFIELHGDDPTNDKGWHKTYLDLYKKYDLKENKMTPNEKSIDKSFTDFLTRKTIDKTIYVTIPYVYHLGKEIGINVSKYDFDQVIMGLRVEKEHDNGDNLDVVRNNKDLLKIVIAHLDEKKDYYTRLKKVEENKMITENLKNPLEKIKNEYSKRYPKLKWELKNEPKTNYSPSCDIIYFSGDKFHSKRFIEVQNYGGYNDNIVNKFGQYKLQIYLHPILKVYGEDTANENATISKYFKDYPSEKEIKHELQNQESSWFNKMNENKEGISTLQYLQILKEGKNNKSCSCNGKNKSSNLKTEIACSCEKNKKKDSDKSLKIENKNMNKSIKSLVDVKIARFLNEMLDYKIKNDDKKIIIKFLNKDYRDGDEGNNVFVDSTTLKTSNKTLAQWENDKLYVTSDSNGAVSRAFKNFMDNYCTKYNIKCKALTALPTNESKKIVKKAPLLTEARKSKDVKTFEKELKAKYKSFVKCDYKKAENSAKLYFKDKDEALSYANGLRFLGKEDRYKSLKQNKEGTQFIVYIKEDLVD